MVILGGVGGSPKSLSIPDARGNQAYLRVTRHPAERKIVVSHWRQGLCVASTPVELSEVSALIGVLAAALGDAVAPESASSAAAAMIPAGTSDRAPGSPTSVLASMRAVMRASMRERAGGSPWWIAPERFIRRFVRPTLAEVTVLRDVRERAPGREEHGGPSDDDRPSDDDPPSGDGRPSGEGPTFT